MGNHKPRFAVTRCSFTLPRFQILARRSVQFISFLFSQNIMQYKIHMHVGLVSSQGSPEETRVMKPLKPGLPSHKEILE